MIDKKPVLGFSLLVLLAGCGSVELPVSAKSASGETFAGVATATVQAGTFSVTSSEGYSCNGTYDQFSMAKRLYLELTCTNGAKGSADIVRDNDLMAGVGTFALDNGVGGSISFGDRYVQ